MDRGENVGGTWGFRFFLSPLFWWGGGEAAGLACYTLESGILTKHGHFIMYYNPLPPVRYDQNFVYIQGEKIETEEGVENPDITLTRKRARGISAATMIRKIRDKIRKM